MDVLIELIKPFSFGIKSIRKRYIQIKDQLKFAYSNHYPDQTMGAGFILDQVKVK